MYTLSNALLKIAVNTIGAELCSIASVKNKNEFMWDANPAIWGSFAPNLFPIIGALKNDDYIFKNKIYTMPKHGFIRHSKDIKRISQTNTSLVFSLKHNKKLLEWYPFKFEFLITYTLHGNTLDIHYTIKNLDKQTIYFSVGGHPAFKCPVYAGEKYSDYSLVFEKEETSKSYLLNKKNGLLTDQTKAVFDTPNSIALKPDLFNNDALIFKDLASRAVALVSKTHGEILTVSFQAYHYLGLWAKPNAHFVCIEPWLGITDHENTTQQLIKKEGIIALPIDESFEASYTIQIHESHLA